VIFLDGINVLLLVMYSSF